MIRFHLFKLIGKYRITQIIIGSLSTWLCLLFLVFYIFDLSSIFVVIAENNVLVGKNYAGTHHKVESVVTDTDGLYNLEFEETMTRTITTKVGETFLSINCSDADWVVYDFGYLGEDLSVHHSVITGVGKLIKEDLYEYSLFNETLNYDRYSTICTVAVNEGGTYTLRLYDSSKKFIKSVELDSLYGVSTVNINDDYITLTVSNKGILKTSSLNVNYVDCFDSDNLYYDINQKVLVKNISDDFATNMLIGSNYFIVLGSCLVFTVLLWFARKVEEFTELREKFYFRLSLSALIALVLGLLLTYIMFL